MPNYEMPNNNNEPKEPNNPENKVENEKIERIPTAEEVLQLFEKFIGEKKYEEIRKLEDENGLYLWEIRIVRDGKNIEYSYCRKGNYKKRGLPGGSAPITAIYWTKLDEDGIPTGGESLAKLIDDEWKITP